MPTNKFQTNHKNKKTPHILQYHYNRVLIDLDKNHGYEHILLLFVIVKSGGIHRNQVPTYVHH